MSDQTAMVPAPTTEVPHARTLPIMLRVPGRTLLLPYAVADEFTRFVIVPLDGLITAMP